jgi:hypothetical protein
MVYACEALGIGIGALTGTERTAGVIRSLTRASSKPALPGSFLGSLMDHDVGVTQYAEGQSDSSIAGATWNPL